MGAGRKAGDNRLQAEAGRDPKGALSRIRRATIGSASDTGQGGIRGRALPEQASERSERAADNKGSRPIGGRQPITSGGWGRPERSGLWR